MSIGICVDHRRRNHSVESLNLNANRLKTYVSKLVMFPRKREAKKGFGGIPNDTTGATNVKQVSIATAMPIEKPSKRIRARAITKEEKAFGAYSTYRKALRDAHNVGTYSKKKAEEGA